MADTFQLEIGTPDRMVVRDQAEEIQIPAKNGYLGVLPGHAPLITEMAVGELSYRVNGTTHYLAVAWGFAEVLPERVTILAESAERAAEVDVQRAQEAKRRAEERLKGASEGLDYDRAQSALRRAEVRLQVASRGTAAASH